MIVIENKVYDFIFITGFFDYQSCKDKACFIVINMHLGGLIYDMQLLYVK